MKLLFFALVALVLLSGCSSKSSSKHQVTLKPYKKLPKTDGPSYKLKSSDPIALALFDEYKKWDGTPYCYGGTSKDGVDCSALVQRIFLDAFGVRVPRTTKRQIQTGYKITKKEVKAGDMVFFKTGSTQRHSGIYLENGNFINTSSKYGVTLSNLNNPYWKAHYTQTRRVLP